MTTMGHGSRTGRARLLVLATLLAAAMVASGAALSACGESSLDGTSWRLSAWSVSSIDPSSFTITATFRDGQIGGTAAVNSYGGPYGAGDDGSLTLGPVSATEMAGPEPAMQAEATYFDLLQRVQAYRIDGDELTMLDGDGNELLIFAKT